MAGAGRVAALCLGRSPGTLGTRVARRQRGSDGRLPAEASVVPPGYHSSERGVPCSGWVLQELVAALKLSLSQAVGSNPGSPCARSSLWCCGHPPFSPAAPAAWARCSLSPSLSLNVPVTRGLFPAALLSVKQMQGAGRVRRVSPPELRGDSGLWQGGEWSGTWEQAGLVRTPAPMHRWGGL